MKISEIELLKLRCEPPEGCELPIASFVTDGSVFLRIITNEGIVGLGEPSPYCAGMETILDLFEGGFRECWLGADPLGLAGQLRQKGTSFGYGHAGPAGLIAGLTQAAWDIRGKVEGKPVHELLSPGSKGRVRAYASGGMWFESTDPSVLVDEALRHREAGYTAFKIRPATPESAGGHLDRNIAPPPVNLTQLTDVLQRIRDSVGQDMDLMVDAGCRLDFDEALSLCRVMEELDCLFLEEPLHRDPHQYAKLKEKTRHPLASGECLVSEAQFDDWVRAGALQVLQPDCNLAGIDEVMAVGSMARRNKVSIVMHNWTNDINNAANVHVGAALSSCSMVEYNLTTNPMRGNLVTTPVAPVAGWFELTEAPGLGVELDESAVAAFAY